MVRSSFTISVLAINASVLAFDGLFQTYSSSSNTSSSMPVNANTTSDVDRVSVQIPAGAFMTVARLSNSSSIRLSIVRIEASARFLYPDETSMNDTIAVILAINFNGVRLENLSRSDQIVITFGTAQVRMYVAL